MAFLRLVGSLLKSLLQLVQFLAQLGKCLLCWIGFLTCLLGGMEIRVCCSVFLILVAIFGSVLSMHAPKFLAQLARLLKTDFLVSLLCGTITVLLGSCLVLVRSFLTGWHMGLLMGTLLVLTAELTCMRNTSCVLQCQMGRQSSASTPMVILRLWSLLRWETISWTGSFSGM